MAVQILKDGIIKRLPEVIEVNDRINYLITEYKKQVDKQIQTTGTEIANIAKNLDEKCQQLKQEILNEIKQKYISVTDDELTFNGTTIILSSGTAE